MIHTEIDTSKLQPGIKVKNYKELCGLLGIEPTTGAAKKKQLKKIDKIISYEKSGYSFIIKGISSKPIMFSEPIPRRDRRKKKPKNIYIKFVELILMQYLTNSSNRGIIEASKIDLFKLIGLVNYKFNSKMCEKKFIEEHNELPNIKENLKHVKSKAYHKLDSILNTALHSLENKRVITSIPTYYITNETGDTYEASEKEIVEITKIEYESMQKLGIREYWEIFSKNLEDQFYDLINEEIQKKNWEKVRRKIKILFTDNIIVKEIKRAELELQKMLLNEEFVEYMEKNISSCLPIEYITEDYLKQYDLIIKSFIVYLSST